jgi:hypothetical protein
VIFVLVLVLCLEEIKVSKGRAESDQHSDDCDKSTCSVADILFKHGVCCFITNLDLSVELLNEF